MKTIQAVHHDQKGRGSAHKFEFIPSEGILHSFKADADVYNLKKKRIKHKVE